MGVVDAPLVISTPLMLYATGTRSSRACSSGRTLPATASAMSLYPFAREKVSFSWMLGCVSCGLARAWRDRSRASLKSRINLTSVLGLICSACTSMSLSTVIVW